MIDKFINPRKIKYLVIHCSDTPNNDKLEALEIHKMHINFGWQGIGYHKVICRSGEIQNGRPEYWIGAHAYGINDISLGVCLIGKDNFNKNQFRSLKKVILKWKSKYPLAIVIGHKDAIETQKSCPNFDVAKWLISEKINHV